MEPKDDEKMKLSDDETSKLSPKVNLENKHNFCGIGARSNSIRRVMNHARPTDHKDSDLRMINKLLDSFQEILNSHAVLAYHRVIALSGCRPLLDEELTTALIFSPAIRKLSRVINRN